jgi:uncharacterized membrane protein YeaQ/YmgE (transglycosylase-associated protein family)
MTTTASALTASERRRYAILLWAITAAWFAAVVIGAQTGFFTRIYMPLIGAIVAATIILPTLWYYLSPKLQLFMDGIGHRRIALMHAWRIPAALLFFWYGLQGQLPFWFWVLAGIGDFIAGWKALAVGLKPADVETYRSLHSFGFADFVVAVGTGLTFTLLQDPLMVTIGTMPMALIPLFGVGISGATHLMAFDMLRRNAGLQPHPGLRPTAA